MDALLGPLGGVLAAIVAGLVAYLAGRRSGRSQAKREAVKDYSDTARRMNDAEIHDNDPAAAERWLRERAGRRDL
jgi:uncharacterized membrane protein YdjX (TVP38/TMEM64 family)